MKAIRRSSDRYIVSFYDGRTFVVRSSCDPSVFLTLGCAFHTATTTLQSEVHSASFITMSGFGGSGFGGGGGGSSGGRGRSGGRSSGRGRGRGRSSGRGRSVGRGDDGGGGGKFPNTIIKACGDFVKSGNCRYGDKCHNQHVVKLHAMIDASSPKPQSSNYNSNYNNRNKPDNMYSVTSVAIWETQGVVKIFTGSQDGCWRLWNFTGQGFVKEFEHNMGGSVECLVVASNFLFCGFESISLSLPDVLVGMVHAWNLASPNDPPLELHIQPNMIPYAHNTAVTTLNVVDATKIVSGSRDGSIRLWTFDSAANGGKGGFVLAQSLPGHSREITGLAVSDTMLWSSATDGAIRIWDLAKNGECQHSITMAAAAPGGAAAPGAHGQGHTDAVTGLVPFNSGAGNFILSCSLDGTVKAWNGSTGQCVASEGHGEGVVCMNMIADAQGKSCLLLGLESGNLWVRNLEPTPKIQQAFAPLMMLSNYHQVAHSGAVRSVCAGPSGTFYTAGDDGKVLVYQITGDLGL